MASKEPPPGQGGARLKTRTVQLDSEGHDPASGRTPPDQDTSSGSDESSAAEEQIVPGERGIPQRVQDLMNSKTF